MNTNRSGNLHEVMHQAAWDSATRVPEGDIRALKHRIHELEGEVIGYKQILDTQPEQAPVAWMYDWTTSDGEFIQDWTTSEAETLRDTEPNIISNIRPLYTAPQCKEWVGLTKEDIAKNIYVEGEFMLPYAFASSIEAKLKEKNT